MHHTIRGTTGMYKNMTTKEKQQTTIIWTDDQELEKLHHLPQRKLIENRGNEIGRIEYKIEKIDRETE